MLPLSRPIIAVLVIFTFMWRWNDFALPLTILTDQAMHTLPVGLAQLKGQYNVEWTDIMSVATLTLLPMVVVFVLFQRLLVQGIASTGLK